MAPKKSAGKGKAGEAAGEAEARGWKSSKCADFHLLGLVEEYLLQSQKEIHWRGSVGESFPREKTSESVIFYPHVLRGLGFPIFYFFRGLLHH